MDAISVKAAQISLNNVNTDAIMPTDGGLPAQQDRQYQAVMLPSHAVSSQSLNRILDSVNALAPTLDAKSGQSATSNADPRGGSSSFTDIGNLPPDLQQALATFRSVALQALVPNVAVSVASGAASSIKRIQQGQ